MSDWSYKGSNAKYKDSKRTPEIEERNRHPKKKEKKKIKRSKHKHEYIPAIYNYNYIDYKGDSRESTACGDHCKICGRVRNFGFNWYSRSNDYISKFKEQYPNYVEIQLPDDWDCFKNKYIPV